MYRGVSYKQNAFVLVNENTELGINILNYHNDKDIGDFMPPSEFYKTGHLRMRYFRTITCGIYSNKTVTAK